MSNNNITDDFQAEILAFFDMTKIKAIDLSRNHMKKLGGAIGKKMRDEISHLKWIDLTMNDFDHDAVTIQTIITGLKRQGGIDGMQHIGLTVQEKQSDALVQMVQPRKPPMSLNLRNSKLGDKAFDRLCKCLIAKDFPYALTGLSLKFCFLSFEHCVKLADALIFNKSLIRLDLSNNGLKSCTTRFILDSLQTNQTLSEISFANNFLDNAFARDLAYVLESNQVLYKVDISQNPIGPAGSKCILNALFEYNDTLGDLGDLTASNYMGVRIREDLMQAIKLNNSSHDKKKNYIEDLAAQTKKKNVDAGNQGEEDTRIVPASIQQTYPLLKPVTFTNIVEDDYLCSGVWNLRQE